MKKYLPAGIFFFTLIFHLPVVSQPFSLLKDINYGNPVLCQGNPRQPLNLTEFNGTLYFTIYTDASTAGLWKTDGTEAGSVRIKEVVAIEKLVAVNGQLFFFTGTFGPGELWTSDGTEAGTQMIKTLNSIDNLTNINGTLFFSADSELWKSDGTEAGTLLVKSFTSISNLVNVNGTLFFSTIIGPPFRSTLWKSDGTEAGTTLVKDNISMADPLNVNGVLYFTGNDGTNGAELWKTDGTETGTIMVKDMETGFSGSNIRDLTAANGLIYFFNYTTPVGIALWKTDGTEAGTMIVKDLSDVNSPEDLTNVGDILFFQGFDDTNNAELWKSDGTEAGTAILKDIFTGASGSYPVNLTNVNGTLFFSALNDATYAGIPVTCSNNSGELWKTDGTEAGTVMVKDIYKGSGGSSPERLINVNGTLFFVASNGINGPELWKSNGLSAGTVLVKDIIFPTGSSNPSFFTLMNGQVYFNAFDAHSGPAFARGQEVHKTDGTLSGTYQVVEIFGLGSSFPNQLTNVNGTLLFSANNGSHGYELWMSDGIYNGTTQMVKDINPHLGVEERSSHPSNFTPIGSLLFFSASDGTHGVELWKSDGTEAGTVMVKDINAGSSHPSNLINVNGVLYFTADNGTNGTELWKSDGTDAGTVMVKDIHTGVLGSSPSYLTFINEVLYFAANDGINGNELWKSDGTNAGTVVVKDINTGINNSNPAFLKNSNGILYFSADNGTNGIELWKSDGTNAGTVMVKDINDGLASSNPASLTDINGVLFFSADDGLAGTELWKSNGTVAGTVLIKDINPGGNSNPSVFTKVGNSLVFTADDGEHGVEIWISNGTEAATRMMYDIEPGSAGSNPTEIIEYNAKILTAATNSLFGSEVWIADAPADIPLPLDFLEFKGTVVNGDGLLQWKTENENNTNEFIVERSIDGSNYNTIGSVTAANSPGIHHYHFTDADLASVGAPVIYYRLKQTDIDGRYSYSNIVTLAIDNKRNLVMLYPNPVKNKINLTINLSQKDKLQWKLADNTGRIVKSGQYDLLAGSTAVSIDIPDLNTGIYFMRLHGSTLQQVIKLVKQ